MIKWNNGIEINFQVKKNWVAKVLFLAVYYGILGGAVYMMSLELKPLTIIGIILIAATFVIKSAISMDSRKADK